MFAPVIDIFPEEEFDDELDRVRSVLLVEGNRTRILAAMGELGAKALVITPEYNESRARDTGRDLVFHVFLDGKKISDLKAFSFMGAVSEILGEEGFVVTFDRDYVPTLPLYLKRRDYDPFSKVIERVSRVPRESGGNPQKG